MAKIKDILMNIGIAILGLLLLYPIITLYRCFNYMKDDSFNTPRTEPKR